jgi:hypothetical protein
MKRTPKNRQEAIAMSQKRAEAKDKGSEDLLQSEIFKSFTNKYPEQRGRLFSTFQNPHGLKQYGIWVARGLVEGVSDLLYIDDDHRIIGIEVKHTEKYHSSDTVKRQAEWIFNCAYRGGFCVSVDMFWQIINNQSNGIEPKKVLKYLENNSKKKSIQFKNIISLQF